MRKTHLHSSKLTELAGTWTMTPWPKMYFLLRMGTFKLAIIVYQVMSMSMISSKLNFRWMIQTIQNDLLEWHWMTISPFWLTIRMNLGPVISTFKYFCWFIKYHRFPVKSGLQTQLLLPLNLVFSPPFRTLKRCTVTVQPTMCNTATKKSFSRFRSVLFSVYSWPIEAYIPCMYTPNTTNQTKQRCFEQNWLVVSTHLKNISQNGNLPQIGVKIKKIFETTT